MSATTNTQIALDQVRRALAAIAAEDLERATPCRDWTVHDLADHLTHVTGQFAIMAAGDDIDWSAPTPREADHVAVFDRHVDALMHVLGGSEAQAFPVSMACGEYAVHTWDLMTALGESTDGLDPAVAEAGEEFMRANLGPDQRGGAFDPERPAPQDANAYERLAAFGGRDLGWALDPSNAS